MAKWEYLTKHVYYETRQEPTGGKGLFGGAKTRPTVWAFVDVRGVKTELDAAMNGYGAEGWELVSAAVAQQFYITGDAGSVAKQGWADAPHALYFKRPKS